MDEKTLREEVIMKKLVLFISFVAWASSVQATGQDIVLPEAKQLLFIIDDSESMNEIVCDPNSHLASRWDIIQECFKKWFEKIDDYTLVGAVSVGGDCLDEPRINMPVGSDRESLRTTIQSARASGQTNLNAILQSSPDMFNENVQGSKYIVLLSDGLNTCPPLVSSCDIARQLYRDHGIIINVAAFITEPGMIDEFQCIAHATGGTFYAPSSPQEWIDLKLPIGNPWRYVVILTGLLAILLAGIIFYRHLYHRYKIKSSASSFIASIFIVIATGFLYIIVFFQAGLFSSLLGAALLAGMFYFTSRGSGDRFLLKSKLTLIIAIFLLPFILPNQTDAGGTGKVVRGLPQHHHILALDMSGSVNDHIEHMKILLEDYAKMYALPYEEVTLLIFGSDAHGAVKNIKTFTVPSTGSTEILNTVLNDLRIQEPKKTKTYFKPLADYINQFLHTVKLQPVIMIVSDGKSDGFTDEKNGSVLFHEISFESLGRGIYNVPNMKGWRVAIQGGYNLDFTTLFNKPINTKSPEHISSAETVLDPCLIDPALIFEAQDRIILNPRINPFSNKMTGEISVWVRNECVNRFRSMSFDLVKGTKVFHLDNINNTLIGVDARKLVLPVTYEKSKDNISSEAVLQIVIDQGGSKRTVYPTKPTVIQIVERSYVSAYGMRITLALLFLISALVASIVLFKGKRRRSREKPAFIRVMGGEAIALNAGEQASIGGPGCSLHLPEITSRETVAFIENSRSNGKFRITAGENYNISINGKESGRTADYKLGQQICFTNDKGDEFNVRIHEAKRADVTFCSGDFHEKSDFHGFEDLATESIIDDTYTESTDYLI